ncbi:MAG: outer membrane lipoprotein carrier protein LolA [Deltaproteobacteria bacterium]
MKRVGYRLVLFGALLFTTVAPGLVRAEAGLKDVVTALEQGYLLLDDLQADFLQRTAIASIKKEQRGSGTLFIKKPSGAAAMFRFNYEKPRQQIVSNGKAVWFYMPENRQVLVSDAANLFDAQNGITLNYLTGLDHVSKDFTAGFAGTGRDKKGNFVLELIPKKQNRVIAKLQITVAASAVEQFIKDGRVEDPFPVISSVVYDPFGNRTAIEFSRAKTNRGISCALFNFKIPSGVDVIKR